MRAAAVLVLAALLAGCGAPAQPAPKAPATPTRDSACLPVAADFARDILDGGKQPLDPVGDAWAIRSDTGDYFVAIPFTDHQGPDLVGVWQTKNLETGPIGAVDGAAQQFTRWPDTKNNGSPVVTKAKKCVS